MDKDLQQLIEKYQNEFRRYRAEHPAETAAARAAAQPQGAPTQPQSAPVQSQTTPVQSQTVPSQPAQPAPDPLSRPEPAVRPDFPPQPMTPPLAQPEMPAQPLSQPEMPMTPLAQPEMPAQPLSQPEMPLRPAQPEMPMPPVSQPERPVRMAELLPEEAADRRRTDRGYIQVRAYTASEATPVPDALVLVLQDGQLVRQTLTDADGLTELMELRTVSRELSQEEGTAHPYTTYDLQITAEGYLPVTSLSVPVFGGVTAIQNIAMIPRPEFDTGRQDEVFQNTEPDL